MRYHLSGTKRGGQGFVIMDAHTDKDGNRSSALFDQMPKLCDNPWYSKKFQTIFQKLHANQARGDGKRKQAKMTELINLAALRLKEADDIAKRKLRNKSRSVSGVRKQGRKTKNSVSNNAKEEALQTLEQMKNEYECIKEATKEMCLGYERIQKVLALPEPFSSCLRPCADHVKHVCDSQVWPPKFGMPKSLVSTDKIATLQALADVEAQSFHRDSPEPGSSGVTSFEEDQYVDVLFHAFQATVILEALRGDRGQATALVRSRLASQNPPYTCSDEAWETILEPRAWEFLVHQEFKARGVKDFEVVRVRVDKTKTIVLDSRTAHAGTPWTGRPGRKRLYKGHFYGFRQDVLRRERDDPTEKDEFTTVDLCDDDHFPIVGWAQRGVNGPIFAVRGPAAARGQL